jgi:hypothetical protein
LSIFIGGNKSKEFKFAILLSPFKVGGRLLAQWWQHSYLHLNNWQKEKKSTSKD